VAPWGEVLSRAAVRQDEITESIQPLLQLSRYTILRLQKTECALVGSPQRDPVLAERVKRLRPVSGVDRLLR
jgi:hypothetical protein